MRERHVRSFIGRCYILRAKVHHPIYSGYYKFAECGDEVNPTIGMEIGQRYTFVQNDVSNYYHPLGFGYIPDSHGSHAHGGHGNMDMGSGSTHAGHGMGTGTDSNSTNTSSNGTTSARQSDMMNMNHSVDAGSGNAMVGSLEHYYSPSGACVGTLSCPAPLHNKGNTSLAFRQGEYGIWEEVPDHGLNEYRSSFFLPLDAWLGEWSVELNFDDATFTEDIFYYCHIHNKMAGRIKLLMRGVPANDQDTPALPEDYYDGEISVFDQSCGTHGLSDFQLPQSQCPNTFVCNADEITDPSLANFIDCLNAMNCHMFDHMTTGMAASSEIALFLNQMIPHHQNAVNMAKLLLKSGKVICDDLLNSSDPMCQLEILLRGIIAEQNHQIQLMQQELAGYPPLDECVVQITETTRISSR